MWQRDLYILGARVDPVTMSEAIKHVSEMVGQPVWEEKKQHYIVTLNPEIVLDSIKDDHYRILINRASLSIPDGFGLRIAAGVFGEKIPERVTGVDLIKEICRLAAHNSWPVYFLGGRGVATQTGHNLKKQFPNLKVAGAEDGINISVENKEIKFDPVENKGLLERINKSGAKILLVAFGAPKQEKWIGQNLTALPGVKLAVGVGGSFDYLSGKVKRAPAAMRGLGLEWLYRLIRQPSRVGRIFNATFKFPAYVIICRLRIKFFYRPNVAGLILNKRNQVLLVAPSRLKYLAWQFPQGGVDRGESEDAAIKREMREELGTDKLEILKRVPNFHSYDWPKWAQCAQCYKGQRQTLYILRFTGEDKDFDLEKDIELKAFKWVSADQLLNNVDKVRRPMAEKSIVELKKLNLWSEPDSLPARPA